MTGNHVHQAEDFSNILRGPGGAENGLEEAQDESNQTDNGMGMILPAVHVDEDDDETAACQQPGEEHVHPVVLERREKRERNVIL